VRHSSHVDLFPNQTLQELQVKSPDPEMSNPVQEFGFTALPRDLNVILAGKKNNADPRPLSVNDVRVPDTPLARKVQDYAKQELRTETYHHSMRVYYYGVAIAKQQFPAWHYSEETYFLTCMLHDIGTTTENLRSTLMSFEFYGGLLALELLHKELHAPKEQAESVAEVSATFRACHRLRLTKAGNHPASRYWGDWQDHHRWTADPARHHLRCAITTTEQDSQRYTDRARR